MPSTERINYLFQRFFDKTYTPEEREELMEYINQSELDDVLKGLIAESWNNQIPEYEQDAHRADEIFRSIVAQGIEEKPVVKRSWLKNMYWYAGGVAAAVLLVWGAMIWWPEQPSDANTSVSSSHIVYQCKAGERASFRLPDGTTVKLNSNSSLTVPDNFSQTNRSVTLKGEGFFDVAHNPQKPFVITTNQMVVKVLGTSFNIKAYEEDNLFETSVIRGSVEVTLARNSQKVVLHRNEKISLTNDAAVVERRVSGDSKTNGATEKVATVQPVTRDRDNSIMEISWTEEKLAFAGETFPEIARKIERWYNVQVTYADGEVKEALQHEGFTATFDNQKLEVVLEALRLANGKFHYEIDNQGNVRIKR